MNQRQRIDQKIFDSVREKFELLDANHKKYAEINPLQRKKERFESNVSLGLVMVEDTNDIHYSEWVTLEEAESIKKERGVGVIVLDPSVWLASFEVKGTEIISKRGEWVIGKGWKK